MSKSARVGIKPPAPAVSFNVAGVGPRDRSIMGNLSTEKYHQKLSLPRVTLPIRASHSANVRQRRPRHETPALDHGRVAARTLGSFYPFWSTGIVKRNCRPNCKLNCKAELPVELSDRQSSCQSNGRVAFCTDCVQFCIEFCRRHTGWMSIEHYWNYTKFFFSSFHLWCSVIMEDSADIELYEEIVGNPSSDTIKSDPVSFQFKEPRLSECREEDFFARARSRPDPRIGYLML